MMHRSNRILELDGLRGIAIGSVLIFHLGLLAPTPYSWANKAMLFGWSGVDLFFVLSGFLIGGILIDNRENENYFSAFYARRFFRIIPVYYLLIAIYYVFYLQGGELRADLISYVGPPMPWYNYLSFTNNIWIAKHNFMEAFASPTWSLAIEEQFYLTLPLLMRLVKPKYFPAMVAALIVGIAGFRITMGHAHAITQIQSYVLSWFRADALMIGVACALIVRNDDAVEFIQRKPWLPYLALLTFGAILFHTGGALLPDTAAPINTYGLTAVALFFASLLLIATILPHHLFSRALCFQPLRYLGKLAYCVYLLHVSALLAALTALDGTPLAHNTLARWAVGLTAIGLVLVAATISWNLFESRMIRLGHHVKYIEPKPQPAPQNTLPLAS